MSAAHEHEAIQARLHAYFDGELPPDEERAVLDHLADCDRCQTSLDDLMGMHVALGRSPASAGSKASSSAARSDGDGSKLDTTTDRPIVSLASRRSNRRVLLIGGGLLAAAAAVALVVTTTRGTKPTAPAVALAPTRPVEVRFSASDFAPHRPYRVERGSSAVVPIPLTTLSALERRGDRATLAAALVWSGDRARAAAVLEQMAADDPSVLADRAAVAILAGDAEAALELADGALRKDPAHAAARWNRALALRDLGLPLAAALQLEELAASGEPGWSAEAGERARALREPVEARRAARLDTSARRRAALAGGGAPLTADDVAIAPTSARHYFHDAVRLAGSVEELDTLAPLAAALDGQSGGDECARELARVRGLDLGRRARFAARYREVVAGRATPADVDALLRDLIAAGSSADDIRLGAIVLGRRVAERLADVERIAQATGNPWFLLLAVQERVRAQRQRPGDAELIERWCSNAAWAFRCAGIASARAEYLAAFGLAVDAERETRRNLALLATGGTGVEEQFAWNFLAEILRERGRLALAAGAATEALELLPDDDCKQRRFALTGLAELARRRGDFARSRTLLSAPEACPEAVDANAVATAVDLARDTGDARDTALASSWIAAGHQAAVSEDFLHVARARLEIAVEAGAREVLFDVIAHPPAVHAATSVDWAWRTLISDDGRRGDWNGAFQHTLAAVGQERPTTCAITLAADDAIHTVAWRDSNGTAGGAQWRAPAEWPALPASALYGCPTTAVIALSPLHGRPPPWRLGAWVWSTGREHGAATDVKRDQVVIAATNPPRELLDLPNLAPVPVPAGARGLTGADATPKRVADAMKTATYVEIHAHGLVDLDVDDGGFVALSPDAKGDWRLTASDVRAMKLAGAPVVVLAACRAAEAAPDRLRRWSLPDAFLAAGARAVIAADVAVPDDLIRTFVDDVRARLEKGEEPAKAAAAARAALVAKDPKSASWVERLMVFE